MEECILWQGSTSGGYPVVNRDGNNKYIHRWILCLTYNLSYKDYSWVAMHLCDNRRCINLQHLMVGNDSLNTLDSVNKKRNFESKKTHCPKGHSYENAKLSKTGKRICKECCKEWDRIRNKHRITTPDGRRVRVRYE